MHHRASTCKLSGLGGSGTGSTEIALATGSLLPKSLGVGGVIPYHHHCLLAALPQFSVCILYCEAWWQGSILSIQSLHHYVKTFSQIYLGCLYGYNMGGKRF